MAGLVWVLIALAYVWSVVNLARMSRAPAGESPGAGARIDVVDPKPATTSGRQSA